MTGRAKTKDYFFAPLAFFLLIKLISSSDLAEINLFFLLTAQSDREIGRFWSLEDRSK